MTPRDSQPDNRPLDEAHLLDWIDGKLSPAEQSRLEQASGRAGLSDRIAQMQSQRRVLQRLPEEAAPADLMDRVLATLEREQLVGGGMPRMVDDVVIRGGSRSLFARFAVAASVALLLGGGLYLASVASRPASTPGPVAKTSESAPLAEANAPARVEETQALAKAESEPDAAIASRAANASDGASGVQLAQVSDALPEPSPLDITTDRAAALASQGRLVMRVLASDTRGLTALEQAGKTNARWRLRKDVPAAVAAAVLPTGPKADIGPGLENQGPMMASAEMRRDAAAAVLAPYVGLRSSFDYTPPNPADPLARVRGTYLLEVPAEVGSLESLKKLFADRLRAGVTFEELPPALAVEPPATPETVMWWTLGPDHWSPRASVPVVVQQR